MYPLTLNMKTVFSYKMLVKSTKQHGIISQKISSCKECVWKMGCTPSCSTPFDISRKLYFNMIYVLIEKFSQNLDKSTSHKINITLINVLLH
jgi:hypothetical protein